MSREIEADEKRGTVEPVPGAVIVWPRYDANDRVEVRPASTGVLISIMSNREGDDHAVFLTFDELDRILTEGRRMHAARYDERGILRDGVPLLP